MKQKGILKCFPQQENTPAVIPFLIMLQTGGRNFIKKEILLQMFSCEFRVFRAPF